MRTERRTKKQAVLVEIIILSLAIVAVPVIFRIAGNRNSKAVLQVITRVEENTQAPCEYHRIYSNNRLEEMEAFSSDALTRYKTDIYGEKIYKLPYDDLMEDQQENLAYKDEQLTKIMKALKYRGDSGSVFECTILRDQDQYFVFAKYNVNWQSPCRLYRYEKGTDELQLLYCFDGVDLVRLSQC